MKTFGELTVDEREHAIRRVMRELAGDLAVGVTLAPTNAVGIEVSKIRASGALTGAKIEHIMSTCSTELRVHAIDRLRRTYFSGPFDIVMGGVA